MSNLIKSIGQIGADAARMGASIAKPGRAINRGIAGAYNRAGGISGIATKARAGVLPGQSMAKAVGGATIGIGVPAAMGMQSAKNMAGEAMGRGAVQQNPQVKLALSQDLIERIRRRAHELEAQESKAAGVDADMLDRVRQRLGIEKSAGVIGNIAGIAATNAIGLAAYSALKSQSRAEKQRASEQVWARIKREHPELATKQGREQFDMLQQMAPTLAANYTAAKSTLMRMDRGNGLVPHEFIEGLGKAEKAVGQQGLMDLAADRAARVTEGNIFGGGGGGRGKKSSLELTETEQLWLDVQEPPEELSASDLIKMASAAKPKELTSITAEMAEAGPDDFDIDEAVARLMGV